MIFIKFFLIKILFIVLFRRVANYLVFNIFPGCSPSIPICFSAKQTNLEEFVSYLLVEIKIIHCVFTLILVGNFNNKFSWS